MDEETTSIFHVYRYFKCSVINYSQPLEREIDQLLLEIIEKTMAKELGNLRTSVCVSYFLSSEFSPGIKSLNGTDPSPLFMHEPDFISYLPTCNKLPPYLTV